jgi:hypothetical protein
MRSASILNVRALQLLRMKIRLVENYLHVFPHTPN